MRYKVGMYGGSFNPLHLGHVDCIIQAANMCEELYIVLSVGNNRDEVDYRMRYRWLYQLTKHIGNVKLITISDEAVTKEEYGEECWDEDAKKVKEQIGKPIDIVFCGSDYDENSFWNKCYPDSEFHVFPRNEISSTEIRKNPYKHWDWLPNVVKPYYVKKVLLMGGESTGKSTLTINLANRFGTNYIDEAGRDISERSGTDLMMISADFTEILLQHKLNEIKAIEYSNKVLFEDTDTLVTQFYMNFLQDPEIAKNKALSDAIDAVNSYDLILFLEPDVPFVQDGDRSEVIRDDRVTYSNQIKDLILSHGKQVVTISGSYQERYEAAVREVERILV
ncbi:HTH-type transcriptional regulator, transcriptional repressor of NAD biosynthesis genes [Pseudobutyrivibrio sp. YE44]|uniref:AAA family ATPase n=1 Tax=Pseudobutyrivibrio sp. YE44 TaxID=1520802 RepID=UPI0008816897|nr:AAA family ATPase [Pseudobutyrivibrio sp. YE44]SDB24012.1 HTH-type transcriptional regulator, transcriptional repressor of NAD biosynthesis genes [Pseudobutyrivibrio sp. YE44]